MTANPLDALQTELTRHRAEKEIFKQAQDQAFEYMDGVTERPVFPPADALEGLAAFEEALPQGMCDPAALLDLLHSQGSPATVAQTGGRYFGFVNGNAIPVAQAARWLSDIWDQNPALYVISPIAAKLEAVCENWLKQLFGLPESTKAGFVGGTSTATLCGLAAGREHLLSGLGWDVNAKGLAGAPKLRVILGAEAHATVYKGLAILGLGTENVELVPCDDQGRMRADQLPELDDTCLVILQAGNVNSGAFDPIDEICTRARAAGAWVHIDGAFGLWAAGAKETCHLTRGIHKADSWSVDAHKTLNAPYDCGIALCRNPEALVRAMQATGSYIIYSENRDSMLYTPEMSRRSRAVELWACLKFLGREGIDALVSGLCRRAREFATALEGEDFTIANEVIFNQVLVSLDRPEETDAFLAALQGSGVCWCGGAVWKGQPVVRISVCSWATTGADVKRCVAAFVDTREKLRK